MPISRVPDLPQGIAIVDDKGQPTPAFQRYWSDSIAETLNALAAGANAAAAAAAATAAADTAIAAAAVAQDAANTADSSAGAAAAAAAATAAEAALVNSYIDPNAVLTGNTTTITVASHTRVYADGTSVAVTGTTIPVSGGVAPYVDYVSYVDAARAGGAVTFTASQNQPTQGMDVHVVGAITVPAAGTSNGGSGPRRPGDVFPEP